VAVGSVVLLASLAVVGLSLRFCGFCCRSSPLPADFVSVLVRELRLADDFRTPVSDSVISGRFVTVFGCEMGQRFRFD